LNDAHSHFSTDHVKRDLRGRTVRGAAATFVGQGSKFLLQMISIAVLARLLTPQDFGLVAMVTAFTGFVMIFKDLGLSMATVQHENISHTQVSTLFWINLGLSILLMLITLALAPAIAWFYGDPRLTVITAALSVAFIFGGLTVQHQALLRRQMRLRAVTVIDVSAMATGILVAVVSAWAGWGYWALVWMQVATALITAAGVWIASGWIPGRPGRRSGVRAMLKFGSYLAAFNFVNYFARNADNILIGRFVGADALGLYSRAYSLLLFPIGQITAPMTAVAVPALSRLQSDPERYKSYYVKAIKIVAYLSMPLIVLMGVLSREIAYLILGGNWLGSSPIFAALVFAAFWSPVAVTVGWIYVSRGETQRMFLWSLITTPLTVLSFVVGIHWGTFGVAVGYSTIVTLQVIPQFWFALRNAPLNVWNVLAAIGPPFVVSLIVMAVSLTVHVQIAGYGYLASLAGTTLATAASVPAVVFLVGPLRNDVAALTTILAQAAHAR